jgi:hypothetical protein
VVSGTVPCCIFPSLHRSIAALLERFAQPGTSHLDAVERTGRVRGDRMLVADKCGVGEPWWAMG